jgi:hypothetical protein
MLRISMGIILTIYCSAKILFLFQTPATTPYFHQNATQLLATNRMFQKSEQITPPQG